MIKLPANNYSKDYRTRYLFLGKSSIHTKMLFRKSSRHFASRSTIYLRNKVCMNVCDRFQINMPLSKNLFRQIQILRLVGGSNLSRTSWTLRYLRLKNSFRGLK